MAVVLVTGATGFIGRATVDRLVRAGHDVHATSRRPPGARDAVTWHVADLLREDPSDVCRAAGASTLVHLAWCVEPGQYWTSLENLDWVAASIRLVRAFSTSGGESAIAVGSAAEQHSSALYPTAKGSLRSLLHAGAGALGLDVAWARVHQLYGPGEAAGRLLPDVISSLLRGSPVRVSAGTQERDFVHVDDVADALVALVSNRVNGTFDVGTGRAIAVADVVRLAAAATGGRDLIEWDAVPLRDGEPACLRADVTPLLEATGWRAQVTIEQGISSMVASAKVDDRR